MVSKGSQDRPLVTQASNLISMPEISSESELGHRLVTLTSAGN